MGTLPLQVMFKLRFHPLGIRSIFRTTVVNFKYYVATALSRFLESYHMIIMLLETLDKLHPAHLCFTSYTLAAAAAMFELRFHQKYVVTCINLLRSRV